MVVSTTLMGVLLTGTHASRPAANTVAKGTLYACSTHALSYQSDGSSWSTWATFGSSGATLQYPSLKPGTPTYDFASASLDGAFSAHSSQGSFATGHVLTQGEDWSGSSVELQFSEQMGALYVTHSNGDLDFQVGGIRSKGFHVNTSPQIMFGIAALNSSGTGVAVVVYNDGTVYLAAVTTWGYTSFSDSWANHGSAGGGGGDWWLRLKRVSGTWTGYVSTSGRAWDKTFSTRSDSVTVDRLAFGLFYSTGLSYSGRLTADYMDVAT
jgi:hypothetical protein